MISATSNDHNENKVLNKAESIFVYSTFDYAATKYSPAEFLFWL